MTTLNPMVLALVTQFPAQVVPHGDQRLLCITMEVSKSAYLLIIKHVLHCLSPLLSCHNCKMTQSMHML